PVDLADPFRAVAGRVAAGRDELHRDAVDQDRGRAPSRRLAQRFEDPGVLGEIPLPQDLVTPFEELHPSPPFRAQPSPAACAAHAPIVSGCPPRGGRPGVPANGGSRPARPYSPRRPARKAWWRDAASGPPRARPASRGIA